jgi:regulator of RNase E activity RraA
VRLNSALQDAWIKPGDYMIADLNGVVSVPKDLAEAVLEVILEIAEADKRCTEGIEKWNNMKPARLGRGCSIALKQLLGELCKR